MHLEKIKRKNVRKENEAVHIIVPIIPTYMDCSVLNHSKVYYGYVAYSKGKISNNRQ